MATERPDFEVRRETGLRTAARVVIKLGTSVVIDEADSSHGRLESHVRSIASLREAGRQVVLVSSGAVGLGRVKLGLSPSRLRDLVTRQACAAVGQSLLMHAYEELFSAWDLKIAQVLLTEDDFRDRRRYSTLRRAIEKLLKLGVIPIVNENDTVSTTELEYLDSGGTPIFSDNDRLAALIMSKLEADALIMLTNVDGLLLSNPLDEFSIRHTEEKTAVPIVTEITPELRAFATGPTVNGRGGMVTKLEAAEIAMRAGGLAVIANGTRLGILDRIFDGEPIGTIFVAGPRIGGKRRWIKYAAGVRGRLIVNAGAREAIIRGKASLLSSGIVHVEEQFKAMEVVGIADLEGREFARGIANYPSQEAKAFISARDSAHDCERAKARVLVRRDNIVLLE